MHAPAENVSKPTNLHEPFMPPRVYLGPCLVLVCKRQPFDGGVVRHFPRDNRVKYHPQAVNVRAGGKGLTNGRVETMKTKRTGLSGDRDGKLNQVVKAGPKLCCVWELYLRAFELLRKLCCS